MDFLSPEKLLRLDDDIARSDLRYHNKRVLVTKEFTFDAAHHLYAYEGKCVSLHGHTYRLAVSVSASPDETGIAIDFADVKAIVQRTVVDRLDHQYLNAVLPPMNTTAENMVVWIFQRIDEALQATHQDKRVERVVLYETPTSSVEITRKEMEA